MMFEKGESKMRFNSCYTEIEKYTASRRCFMTGEYCSKQMHIQRERNLLHEKNEINAFVIMNFSNMSDVVYKWRMRGFIESLTKYLYFMKVNNVAKRLYCFCNAGIDNQTQEKERFKEENKEEGEMIPVKHIHVIRSDSNPTSNFVMCSRVCQQLQIADLVIVDVSVENTNVFYELGMAVAMGKLILPICYSESFYDRILPKKLQDLMNKEYDKYTKVEHHIGCYPWRKSLFEHFGIKYRRKECFISEDKNKDLTQYLDYCDIVEKSDYGFDDRKYCMFPYNETVVINSLEDTEERKESVLIGKKIYEKLKTAYNNSTNEENTLVVYTMDGIMNESEAGLCIVNYYTSVVARMKAEGCFCGDRVGVLVQSNAVPEDVKDSSEKKHILYSVGEIIHIGMNQATYNAVKVTIKADDYLYPSQKGKIGKTDFSSVPCPDDINRFTKDYVRNRCMMIYPCDPVYVKRVKNGMQSDIFNRSCELNDTKPGEQQSQTDVFFCFYHVMLRTLKYTNEIVVDISTNSVQSLFWLGAAHGSDVYAISVRHEQTNDERKTMTGKDDMNERSIFDVSGLWTAIFHSYDTEGFYKQLLLAQLGIEQHTRLLIKDSERLEEELVDKFYKEDGMNESGEIEDVIKKKRKQSKEALESYYRHQFWSPMISSNQLNLYMPRINGKSMDKDNLQRHNLQWDVDAIAEISHYLSKRKVIGEYHLKTLDENEADASSKTINFLCVGNIARPLPEDNQNSQSLPVYVNKKIKDANEEVWQCIELKPRNCESEGKNVHTQSRIYKGFKQKGTGHLLLTQISHLYCYSCLSCITEDEQRQVGREGMLYFNEDELDEGNCTIKNDALRHSHLGQVLLWRERDTRQKRVHYWASLTGASGPATLALTSVLLDEEQKKLLFSQKHTMHDSSDKKPNDDGEHLLASIQASIRNSVLTEYCSVFKEKIRNNDEDQIKLQTEEAQCYYDCVLYATTMYLSATLYRYFLPFLSLEDESRICNGMQMFIFSLIAGKIGPFVSVYPENASAECERDKPSSIVGRCVRYALESLKIVLEEICGVEALFEIAVSVDNEKVNENHMSDARVIDDIQFMRKSVVKRDKTIEGGTNRENEIYVNGLFAKGK